MLSDGWHRTVGQSEVPALITSLFNFQPFFLLLFHVDPYERVRHNFQKIFCFDFFPYFFLFERPTGSEKNFIFVVLLLFFL